MFGKRRTAGYCQNDAKPLTSQRYGDIKGGGVKPMLSGGSLVLIPDLRVVALNLKITPTIFQWAQKTFVSNPIISPFFPTFAPRNEQRTYALLVSDTPKTGHRGRFSAFLFRGCALARYSKTICCASSIPFYSPFINHTV